MKFFRLRLSIVPFFACLLVIGCTNRVIPTVAVVDDFSNYTKSYYSGTARVWKKELAKSRNSGKSRAIILDHGENIGEIVKVH